MRPPVCLRSRDGAGACRVAAGSCEGFTDQRVAEVSTAKTEPTATSTPGAAVQAPRARAPPPSPRNRASWPGTTRALHRSSLCNAQAAARPRSAPPRALIAASARRPVPLPPDDVRRQGGSSRDHRQADPVDRSRKGDPSADSRDVLSVRVVGMHKAIRRPDRRGNGHGADGQGQAPRRAPGEAVHGRGYRGPPAQDAAIASFAATRNPAEAKPCIRCADPDHIMAAGKGGQLSQATDWCKPSVPGGASTVALPAGCLWRSWPQRVCALNRARP